MSDEPGHKAMLYFLEVLMNSNGPLTISQLAGRFGSRSFSAEMRASSGGNEDGLKKFLLKYPSLFTVRGNMVSLFDGKSSGDTDPEASSSTPTMRRLPDVSAEMAAVQYFQSKLAKKEERWVHIKSLAGHLSQASLEVRDLVGPQLDFRKWLMKHPHIFEVQGELVSLRDGIAAVSTPASTMAMRRTTFALPDNKSAILPPKTPPPSRRIPPKTPPALRRSHSFSEKRVQQIEAQAQVVQGQDLAQPPSTPVTRRRAPVTMTANEYKAVMFLKDVVEKKGGIKLHNITGYFNQAAEGVRNTIGWTKTDLEEFLKKNASVFSVTEDELVVVNKNAKLNVIITGSRPQGQGPRSLTARMGKIFHVAKLWGIVDLGKHEHVFFDKSIMKKPVDDLQKEYQIGDTLCFHAVLAPKSSRAKWKATQVWKEDEQQPMEGESLDFSMPGSFGAMSPSISIEDEINRFLPASCDSDSRTSDEDKFSDAAPSGTGVIAVWNIGEEEDDPRADVTVVRRQPRMSTTKRLIAERHRLSAPCLQNISPVISAAPTLSKPPPEGATNGIDLPSEVKVTSPANSLAETAKINGEVTTVKKYAEVACQTVSTGDIIATQLYDDK